MKILVMMVETKTITVASNAANNRAVANLTKGFAALGVSFELVERVIECDAPTQKAQDAAAEAKSSTAAVTKSDED